MRERRVRWTDPAVAINAGLIMPLDAKIDTLLETQFAAGRLYATITSRPGQSGRADGYILEGKELEVSLSVTSVKKIILTGYFPVLLEENQNRQTEACSCLNVSYLHVL